MPADPPRPHHASGPQQPLAPPHPHGFTSPPGTGTGAVDPQSQSQSQATLALLLHNTTLDRDEAARQRDIWHDKAERAERLLRTLSDRDADLHSGNSANSASPLATTAAAAASLNGGLPFDPAHLQATPGAVFSLLIETQSQLDTTKAQLKRAESRVRTILEAWDGYEKYQNECERRASDARIGVGTVLASLCDFSRSDSDVAAAVAAASGSQQRPTLVQSTSGSIHARNPAPQAQPAPASQMALNASTFPNLPLPPPIGPSTSGARRGRPPSADTEMDRERSKRIRAEHERPQRVASEERLPHARHDFQHQQHITHSPPTVKPHSPHRGWVHAENQRQDQHQNAVSMNAANSARANTLPPIHSRYQDIPQVSLPEQAHQSLPAAFTPSLHFVHHPNTAPAPRKPEQFSSRGGERMRRRRRDEGDASDSGNNSVDDMILDVISHRTPSQGQPPGHGPGGPFPRVQSQSRQSMHGDTSTGRHFPPFAASTTGSHIFAAPLVDAPHSKKSRSTASTSGKDAEVEMPSVVHPATNELGQRTCRQCGQAGRYKEGKCVEKWGPGPLGPGTVCDRCRKKMKRVERRGLADAAIQPGSLAQAHPGPPLVAPERHPYTPTASDSTTRASFGGPGSSPELPGRKTFSPSLASVEQMRHTRSENNSPHLEPHSDPTNHAGARRYGLLQGEAETQGRALHKSSPRSSPSLSHSATRSASHHSGEEGEVAATVECHDAEADMDADADAETEGEGERVYRTSGIVDRRHSGMKEDAHAGNAGEDHLLQNGRTERGRADEAAMETDR